MGARRCSLAGCVVVCRLAVALRGASSPGTTRAASCRVDISYHESKPGADDVQALLAAWWPKPFTTDRWAQYGRQEAAAWVPACSKPVGTIGHSISRGVVSRIRDTKLTSTL